ncbi:MAG TPA: TorF family putative porin [Kiritimatiellia bacterium]|nr:TorF family putative porin [Kiritimatiellia bacterium]
MKKQMTKVLAAVAAASVTAGSAALAAEATVGVDVSSAYVFRGATFNDGFVAQPYLDVSGLPIDIGVWGNLDIDDYDDSLNSGEFSEINIYASYTIPVEGVDASIGYTEYIYPGAELEADREVSLSLGLDVPLAPSVGIYYGLDGGIKKNIYVEAGLGHDIELDEGISLSLGAAVGYLNPDEGESGFSHWQVSAALNYDFISLGVTYVDTIDKDVLGDAYDVEVIGTLSLSYSF